MSKMTAARQRLRELDKKYKNRPKYLIDSDSSYSTAEVTQQKIVRPQLNIKMPDAYEHLDTNSDNDNQPPTRVQVVSNLPLSSSSSSSNKDDTKNVRESIRTSIKDLDLETIDVSDLEPSNGSSISEDLDKTIQSVSVNPDSDKQSLVESAASTPNESERVNVTSTSTSTAKYSEDSFDSSSSSGNDRAEAPISPENPSLVSTLDRKEILEIIVNSQPNEEDKSVTEISKSTDQSAEIEEAVNKETLNPPSSSLESALIIKSTSSQEVSASRNGDSNVTGTTDPLNKSKTLKLDSNSRDVSLEISSEQSNFSVSKRQAESNAHETPEVFKDTNEEKAGNEHIRAIKSPKSVPTEKKTNKVTRKYSDRKMIDDRHRFRREQERIHATMFQYLQKMEQDQQSLLLWPTRLICPERVEICSLKPLDFPKIVGFTRSKSAITNHSDPSLEMLSNRMLDIRQWLKEQYLLYREHCAIASTINKTYSPVTLEDARKVLSHVKQRSIDRKIQKLTKLKMNTTI